jgi:ABC-type nitrate/sulfonate/bicarbonate transport system permease component
MEARTGAVTLQQRGVDRHPAAISTPESASVEQRRAPARRRGHRGGTDFGRLPTTALRIVVPAVILGVWWGLSTSPRLGLYIVDPLTGFERFFTDFFSTDVSQFFLGEATFDHLLPSVGRALAGLAMAIAAGVGVGVLLGVSPVLFGLFQPLVHLGRSLPSPALLGVFFFMFGTGDSPKIFLIAFSVVWPILLNTIDGVTSIGQIQAHAAQIFRIPSRDVLFHIVLPGASPKIFAGIRTSLALSLILMIISELQKSENGLGYQLIQSQRNFDYGGFWSVLVMLVILGLLFNLVFTYIERRALAWHRGATQQND